MEIRSNTEKGEIVISDEVISSIAINAAKDVEGVASLSSKPLDVVSTIKQGSLRVMSPVRISQEGDIFTLSIYINLEPNKKVQVVASEVQKAVKESVQNMTGKLVNKVNVIAAGVEFPTTAVEESDNEQPLD